MMTDTVPCTAGASLTSNVSNSPAAAHNPHGTVVLAGTTKKPATLVATPSAADHSEASSQSTAMTELFCVSSSFTKMTSTTATQQLQAIKLHRLAPQSLVAMQLYDLLPRLISQKQLTAKLQSTVLKPSYGLKALHCTVPLYEYLFLMQGQCHLEPVTAFGLL